MLDMGFIDVVKALISKMPKAVRDMRHAPHWHGGFESSHRSHSKISHLSQPNFSRFPKAEEESRSWKNVFKTYDGNANGCHHESMSFHVASSNWDGFARPESIVLRTGLCGCADACRKKCLLEIGETRACRIRQRTHKVMTCEATYKICKWPVQYFDASCKLQALFCRDHANAYMYNTWNRNDPWWILCTLTVL